MAQRKAGNIYFYIIAKSMVFNRLGAPFAYNNNNNNNNNNNDNNNINNNDNNNESIEVQTLGTV